MLQKIKLFLTEYDFFWSIPTAFLGFIFFPVFGQLIWGEGFAMYPPDFFHAAIYAALLIVLFNSVVQMGIKINFPEMYSYYLKNFQELSTWQKLLTFSFFYFFFFASLLFVWQTIV
jgi:hypothetical protein